MAAAAPEEGAVGAGLAPGSAEVGERVDSESEGQSDQAAQLRKKFDAIMARAAPLVQKMKDAVGVRKSDLAEMKAVVRPPPAVQKAMDALMVLTGRKAGWMEVQKALSQTSFLTEVGCFDRAALTELVVDKVEREYLAETDVETVRRQGNVAAAMLEWVACVCAVYRIEQEALPIIKELHAIQNNNTEVPQESRNTSAANAQGRSDNSSASGDSADTNAQIAVDLGSQAGTAQGPGRDTEEKLAYLRGLCEGLSDKAMQTMTKMQMVVDCVQLQDLGEIKAISTPSAMTEKACEAWLLIMGKQSGWDEVKRVVRNPSFLSDMNRFDRTQLTEQLVGKLEQEYLAKLSVEDIRMQSKFAAAMLEWVGCVCQVYRIEQEAMPILREIKVLEEISFQVIEKTTKVEMDHLKKEQERGGEKANSLADDMEMKLMQLGNLLHDMQVHVGEQAATLHNLKDDEHISEGFEEWEWREEIKDGVWSLVASGGKRLDGTTADEWRCEICNNVNNFSCVSGDNIRSANPWRYIAGKVDIDPEALSVDYCLDRNLSATQATENLELAREQPILSVPTIHVDSQAELPKIVQNDASMETNAKTATQRPTLKKHLGTGGMLSGPASRITTTTAKGLASDPNFSKISQKSASSNCSKALGPSTIKSGADKNLSAAQLVTGKPLPNLVRGARDRAAAFGLNPPASAQSYDKIRPVAYSRKELAQRHTGDLVNDARLRHLFASSPLAARVSPLASRLSGCCEPIGALILKTSLAMRGLVLTCVFVTGKQRCLPSQARDSAGP